MGTADPSLKTYGWGSPSPSRYERSPSLSIHPSDHRAWQSVMPNSPPKYHLDQLLIADSREAGAVAEVELPRWPHVQVHDAVELMLLFGQRLDAIDGAGRSVVFD